MSENKCASCGQWAGKGHRCPTPSNVPAPVDVPAMAGAPGYANIDTGDRVNRARDVIANRAGANEMPQRTPEQADLVARVQRDIAEGRSDYGFEVHEGGRPVGVITFTRDDNPDNPRAYDPSTNVAQIGLFRHKDDFASLNEVDIVYDPDNLDWTRNRVQEWYGDDYTVVPLKVARDRVEIATDAEIERGRYDGFAVIEQGTFAEYGGSKERTIDALRMELEDYNDYATGNVWVATYESADGKTSDTCHGWVGDPVDTAHDFLRDYGPKYATIGMKLY